MNLERRNTKVDGLGMCILIALGAVILLFALMGCVEPNVLEEGQVVKKEYDDPDDWDTSYCIYEDEDNFCYVWGTEHHHDDAHYYLKVHGTYKGKDRTETHEVTEYLFNIVSERDIVNFPNQQRIPR